MGPQQLSHGAGPRDRGPSGERGLRRAKLQGRRPGRRRLHGGFLPELRSCADGLEQYCEKRATFTYNDVDRHDKLPTYGGYSERIVVTRKFVVRVPKELDLKSAAPLLCAGITMYSPLRHWQVGKGSKIASWAWAASATWASSSARPSART